MSLDDIEVEGLVPASPERIYAAWINTDLHAAMTGAAASCDPEIGGAFTAWDGYISGRTLELEPHRRIVQAWRTAQFPEDAADSRLEITLSAEGDGTRVKFRHTGIPAGQGVLYEKGWVGHYLEPMTAWARGA